MRTPGTIPNVLPRLHRGALAQQVEVAGQSDVVSGEGVLIGATLGPGSEGGLRLMADDRTAPGVRGLQAVGHALVVKGLREVHRSPRIGGQKPAGRLTGIGSTSSSLPEGPLAILECR
ncbi:MAG: hypothetical protein EOP84_31745 [Verrucomicrobiaceae bacterium]|nr:MAG: hypothetical protein EOP84_31745 [Verrucomicrobiaceae bacterium]